MQLIGEIIKRVQVEGVTPEDMFFYFQLAGKITETMTDQAAVAQIMQFFNAQGVQQAPAAIGGPPVLTLAIGFIVVVVPFLRRTWNAMRHLLARLKKVPLLTVKSGQWWAEKKRGGVLCPLFSGKRKDDQGIGDLKWLEMFIDFLDNQGGDMIFLLPTTQINPGGLPGLATPYGSISTFAQSAILHLPLDEYLNRAELGQYIDSFAAGDAQKRQELIEAIRARKINYPFIYAFKKHCWQKVKEGVGKNNTNYKSS